MRPGWMLSYGRVGSGRSRRLGRGSAQSQKQLRRKISGRQGPSAVGGGSLLRRKQKLEGLGGRRSRCSGGMLLEGPPTGSRAAARTSDAIGARELLARA